MEVIKEAVIAIIYLIPVMIFKEGYKMFKEHMNEHKLWDYVPYFILAILVFILIILLLSGYKY